MIVQIKDKNRMQVFTAVVNRVIVYLQAPKKIAAWLLKRQLPSNPDDRGTTRKTITPKDKS
jgi:hypothetical protein